MGCTLTMRAKAWKGVCFLVRLEKGGGMKALGSISCVCVCVCVHVFRTRLCFDPSCTHTQTHRHARTHAQVHTSKQASKHTFLCFAPRCVAAVQKLGRRAAIGFCSSLVSDTTSNSIRVTKVTKQAHTEPITYVQAVREVISKDGVTGLFFRGLGTRLLANGMQGMMFTSELLRGVWGGEKRGGEGVHVCVCMYVCVCVCV